MRLSKLDNRFRMKKAGIATYMADVPIDQVEKVKQILIGAFGPGRYVPPYQNMRYIPNNRDWYYSAVYSNQSVIVTSMINGRQLTSYRFYLRREEQATFLALAIS